MIKKLKRLLDDARRYRKLRDLMTRNLEPTWEMVQQISAIGCWMSHEDFDEALDTVDLEKLTH